jgi:hypothetical protein
VARSVNSKARFIVVAAVAMALFSSGVVAGAAGAPLILGQSNSASGKLTSLTSSRSGAAFKITNPGSGRALALKASGDVPLRIEGPIGKAPLAVTSAVRVANLNADRVDGLHASQLARGQRRTIDSFSGVGVRILLDSRTGADVRLGSTPGVLRITNTSATQRMLITGVGTWGTAAPEAKFANLGPGETATFTVQTLYPTFLDVAITLSAMNVANVRYSHLTCSTADVGGGPSAMTSCLVVG